MQLFGITALAIVVEGIITYFRTFFVEGKFKWQVLAALALGVASALAYGLDLLAMTGLESRVPWFGMALTGILLSRGSNYVFDLLGQLNKK